MYIQNLYFAGFLKARAREMFANQLPEEKMQVIQSLGFGTVNKIYLEFDQPFWDEECAGEFIKR